MKFRNTSIKSILPKLKALFPPSGSQQQPREKSVLLIPNSVFFTQQIAIPDGITPEDYNSFAEITLEDLAPFPLESLAWGYAVEENSLLIYATPKDRLKSYETLDTAFHVFPAFLALKGHSVIKPTIFFLRTGNTLSALSLSPGAFLPHPLRSIELGIDSTEEDFFVARTSLEKQYRESEFTPDEGIISVEDASSLSDGSICFVLARQSSPDSPIVEIAPNLLESSESLWQADIRDSMAKYAFKKSRELSKRLWKSLQIAAGAALLILLLNISILMGSWIAGSREKTIKEQTPTVTRIEENQELQDKLNQFYNEELKPFDLLNVLNEVRPRSIYFTTVSSSSFDSIEVRGIAGNVEEVNAYTADLQNATQILSVELTDILTRQGMVNFTLKATIALSQANPIPTKSETTEAPTATKGEGEASQAQAQTKP